MNKLILISGCLMALGAGQVANATSYTGSLNADGGGLSATDGWDSTTTKISWTVTDVGTVGNYILWQYNYTYTVPEKAISHFIIEVSPDAAAGDFNPVAGGGTLGTWESQGNSNPGIPSEIYGLKFDMVGSPLTYTFSFTTTRSPVWGDFYAKDGVDNPPGPNNSVEVYAYNLGLTDPDTDPSDLPSDGSVLNHILRPDTQATRRTPDGGATAALLGLGVLSLGLLARNRV